MLIFPDVNIKHCPFCGGEIKKTKLPKGVNRTNLRECPFCGGETKKVKLPIGNTIIFICLECGYFYGAEHDPEANDENCEMEQEEE